MYWNIYHRLCDWFVIKSFNFDVRFEVTWKSVCVILYTFKRLTKCVYKCCVCAFVYMSVCTGTRALVHIVLASPVKRYAATPHYISLFKMKIIYMALIEMLNTISTTSVVFCFFRHLFVLATAKYSKINSWTRFSVIMIKFNCSKKHIATFDVVLFYDRCTIAWN